MGCSQARPLEGRPPISVGQIFNMSANNDAGSERNGARLDDDAASFVYTSQNYVPHGVIRVRVHPSIKVIRARTFFQQARLIGVELHDGIEVIEKEAFYDCRSLREILFPPLRQGDRGFGIPWLLTVGGCNSQRWAGGDWGVGI